MPNGFQSALACAQSNESPRFPQEESLHPLLFEIRTVKKCANARGNLNLCLVYRSDGTFSDGAALFL